METVRGFSFMPQTTVKVGDHQFIESGELERTWKHSRRQRLKEQEQKVWEEFVKEQDIVKVVSDDDPYQFLHELPASCLKELMDDELQKAIKEEEECEKKVPDQPNQGEGDHQREEIQHAVTFADEEREDCDMFLIFDDEKDDPSGVSGPEDEVINESCGSRCTVRERDSVNTSPVQLHEKGDNKTAENMSNVIESSIYCAKVKDLRLKIHDEMLSIMATLERQDVMTIEQEDVSRLCRRSAEFSARFNRIYMYQLQRQMHDVKRHGQHEMPFAKHTHFHAQMVRVCSLHQNFLQAMQIFHKSIEQTACLRESAAQLHALCTAARDLSALSAAVRVPHDLRHAALIYNDEMLALCDKLDDAVCEHSLRVADFLSVTDSRSPSKKSKSKGKRKLIRGVLSKTSRSTADTEARLSMYSLDPLRTASNAKTSSKENHSCGTSKARTAASSVANKSSIKNEKKSPKSPKKSPRSRRPLMRAGASPAPRARARPPRDTDIVTMVQAVETCTSSHMSREASPQFSPRASPRARPAPATQRKSVPTTPRPKFHNKSPKMRTPHSAAPPLPPLTLLPPLPPPPHDSCGNVGQMSPVSKIQCAKKEIIINLNPTKPDKILDKLEKNDRNTEKDKTADNADNKSESGKDFESLKESESFLSGKEKEREESPRNSTREEKDGRSKERSKPARCEVTMLLKHLCSGDAAGGTERYEIVIEFLHHDTYAIQDCLAEVQRTRSERVSGARNAQLLCVNGGSPRPPSTPQLLRILEETIQKKAPKPMYPRPSVKDPDRFRMLFNISHKTTDNLYQYRTRFVQHMLASSMYANSAVGKPWEMICSVSDMIIDELLVGCAKEMQIRNVIQDLYNSETK